MCKKKEREKVAQTNTSQYKLKDSTCQCAISVKFYSRQYPFLKYSLHSLNRLFSLSSGMLVHQSKRTEEKKKNINNKCILKSSPQKVAFNLTDTLLLQSNGWVL